MLRDQVTLLFETLTASHCPYHLHGSLEFFPRLRWPLNLGSTLPSDASVWNSSAVSLRRSYTCTMRCDHTHSSQLPRNSESTSFLTASIPPCSGHFAFHPQKLPAGWHASFSPSFCFRVVKDISSDRTHLSHPEEPGHPLVLCSYIMASWPCKCFCPSFLMSACSWYASYWLCWHLSLVLGVW